MKLYSLLILAMLFAVPASIPSCNTVQQTAQNTATNITQTYFPTTNTITLASFNVQVFGQDKMSDPEVINVLKQIVKRYDIIMIQEIRDASGQTMPEFVRQLNDMPGNKYQYVISERLGDSISKEQYAIIYRNDTLVLGGTRQFPDNKNFFERPPFSAKFNVRGGNLDFVLVDAHIQPSNATYEINHLYYAMEDTRDYFNEPDVILGGDLNSDCSYYDESSQNTMRNQIYAWIIPDDADTSLSGGQCTYDRFIIYRGYSSEDFTGQWGVFNFQKEYGLTDEVARKVSDHLPIWMEMYINKDSD